ncbi:hypothetical protein CFN78_16425 [Amycolatopsis antarctica]|uniref:YbaB/EbfC family DNA-binding protein n=1 Tax=Amycolatopsis antarctica TaxID=1854586 RepID=A0A263D0Y1_9PSEU|nr:YbaB/EbfC family nucleoid-associated protein [Amycolatopsis antarctica]OZM72124.1 hypothetical protein CFN78_16425 [Amycolatopsis antarctica]
MSYEMKIRELMADYHRQRASLAEMQHRMKETVGTAVAPRQAAKATVNANGELAELTFPTNAYKSMAPKELSTMLLKVIGDARVDAMRSVTGMIGAQLGDGSETISDLLGPDADITKLITSDSLMAPEVREYLGGDAVRLDQEAASAEEESWPKK